MITDTFQVSDNERSNRNIRCLIHDKGAQTNEQ